MFKPNFRYTHGIVTVLTKIAASREVVLNSPLVPKWEVSLRREAMVRSAHSSTSIEGNKLTLEQVSKLAEGRNIMAARKDKQEVLNYLNVLERLDALVDDGKTISEKTILRIHKQLTKDTLDDPSDSGVYRKKYVVVGNRFTGHVNFYPPQNEQVPLFMQEYVEWLNSPAALELDAVIEAGIAHYEFVRIHPFVDGNGRTARVMAALLLYLRGFDTKRFFSLDDYYDADRKAYYAALGTVDKDVRDVTKWLEYFVEGVAVSIEAVKERVIRLSSERLRTKERGQIALTERQMRIVEHINQKGKISNKDVRAMFKITAPNAHKELLKLVEMGVIQTTGKGRSLSYELKTAL
jgi:Fic family protein